MLRNKFITGALGVTAVAALVAFARLRDPAGNIIFLYRAGEARRFPPWRMTEG